MAEDTQPHPLTLQQRIASLNAAHLSRAPREASSTKPRPIVPDRRPLLQQKSFNLPNENTVSSTAQPAIANTPSGPPPLPSRKAPPLPARKNLQQPAGPQNGVSTTIARVTATRTKSEEHGSEVKVPAWHEAMILPSYTTRTGPRTSTKSVSERPPPVNRTVSVSSTASTMTSRSNSSVRPPQLPSRKASTDSTSVVPSRKMPPLPTTDALEKARKASFSSSVVEVQDITPIPPLPTRRPSAVPVEEPKLSLESTTLNACPPPIPSASRPDLSAIQATKPKVNGHSSHVTSTSSASCMTCRDFSGPDDHALRFPRQHVTSLQTLAQQLVAPFPSLTDKARAIFTWLHHNIDYDVKSFFSGNIKGSTPQSTLQSGLAVCEGYASLFTNLAMYASLESRVVGGHGKGFGHVALQPGQPLPPYEGNHAWNVVRIDNGEWKLIDACWGAGHVQGAGMPYCRKFSSERFTQSNEEFGIDHFPNSQTDFFLPNGRTMSWEEYIQINPAFWPYQFERPTLFNNATEDYSVGKHTVMPPSRGIEVYQRGTVRFQFGLFCPHWSLENHNRKGPPPVFVLAAGGVDGRDKHYVPLDHVRAKSPGSGGDMWYVDVPARELGALGETLTLFAVTSFGNRQDARGLSVQEFKNGVGRTAMGFVGVAAWDLV